MIKYYVYFLQDPTISNKGYVGITKDLNRRYKDLITDKKDSLKTRWLNNLKEKDLKPNMLILEEYICISECKNGEVYYIKKMKDDGYILKNMTDGGDGVINYIFTEKDKEKMRQSHLGKKLSVENKEKISKSLKGREKTQKTKEMRSNTCYQFDLYNNLLSEYYSIREASRVLKLSSGHISECCNKKRKSCGGFKFSKNNEV